MPYWHYATTGSYLILSTKIKCTKFHVDLMICLLISFKYFNGLGCFEKKEYAYHTKNSPISVKIN